MKLWIFLSLLLLVQGKLDYSRVHLVGHDNMNTWFFRGSLPANKTMFQYADLQSMMSHRVCHKTYSLCAN